MIQLKLDLEIVSLECHIELAPYCCYPNCEVHSKDCGEACLNLALQESMLHCLHMSHQSSPQMIDLMIPGSIKVALDNLTAEQNAPILKHTEILIHQSRHLE